MVVWVIEMARYVPRSWRPDNRCKGIQREYEGLPKTLIWSRSTRNTGCFSHDFEAI